MHKELYYGMKNLNASQHRREINQFVKKTKPGRMFLHNFKAPASINSTGSFKMFMPEDR